MLFGFLPWGQVSGQCRPNFRWKRRCDTFTRRSEVDFACFSPDFSQKFPQNLKHHNKNFNPNITSTIMSNFTETIEPQPARHSRFARIKPPSDDGVAAGRRGPRFDLFINKFANLQPQITNHSTAIFYDDAPFFVFFLSHSPHPGSEKWTSPSTFQGWSASKNRRIFRHAGVDFSIDSA